MKIMKAIILGVFAGYGFAGDRTQHLHNTKRILGE